jgi:HAMP domain-containing protein
MKQNVKQYLVAASVAIGLALSGVALDRVESAQRALHTLATHTSETANKSATARVITVAQRCELTGLILEVIVKDDPRRAGDFRKSYTGCQKQLVEVKKIAEEAVPKVKK